MRVRRIVRIGAYLDRANELFKGAKPFEEIKIRGVGRSIPSVLTLVELIKHKFAGLHQQNEVSTVEFEDKYEPLEEGLDVVIKTRTEPMIMVTLSLKSLPDKLGY